MSYSSHSSSASSSSSQDTSPSSVHSFSNQELEQWAAIHGQTEQYVGNLIKEKRYADVCLQAYRVRCETLEAEVARLAGLLESAQVGSKSMAEVVSSDIVSEKSTSSTPSSPTSSTLSRKLSSNGSSTSDEGVLHVDPTKSMSKQNPPPCNAFYLLGHCQVPRCKFSHRYELSPEHIKEMSRGARFHICNTLKAGKVCTDPECCYGHSCPRGASCSRVGCAFNDEQHSGPATRAERDPVAPRSGGGRSRKW